MKSWVAVLFLFPLVNLVAAIEQLDSGSQFARLSEPFEIHRKPNSLFPDLGIINGLRQCGGSGRLLYWRDEACALHPHSLCQRPVDQYFRAELAFIPSQSSDSLGVRVMVKDASTGKKVTEWENPNIPGSAVEAEKEYVVAASTAAGSEVQGKLLTTKIHVFRDSDKEIEACAEVDIYYT